jgi:hypothetical protein
MGHDAAISAFNIGVGHAWLIATMVPAAFLISPWFLLMGVLAAAYMFFTLTKN